MYDIYLVYTSYQYSLYQYILLYPVYRTVHIYIYTYIYRERETEKYKLRVRTPEFSFFFLFLALRWKFRLANIAPLTATIAAAAAACDVCIVSIYMRVSHFITYIMYECVITCVIGRRFRGATGESDGRAEGARAARLHVGAVVLHVHGAVRGGVERPGKGCSHRGNDGSGETRRKLQPPRHYDGKMMIMNDTAAVPVFFFSINFYLIGTY